MLSDDLARWFDDGLYRLAERGFGNRFAVSIRPDELIGEAPSAIWPALMPCDFLPLLTNDLGDWLCVRLAADNAAAQIVHWYHGGGDWIPWGNTISEAIYFDHVRHRLPGSQRDHAIAADANVEADDRSCSPINQWAMDQLTDRSAKAMDELTGLELAQAMLDQRISVPAVLCQLVIAALDNPLLTDEVVQSWQVNDADRLQRALLDNRLLSDEWLATAVTSGQPTQQVLAQQDWERAREYCRLATESAPELAWGWDLLGYAHERSGQLDLAEANYRRGLHCSVFTDQTVRVRTHGFNGEGQKLSASRLMDLGYQPTDPIERDYFDCLCAPTADQRRDKVREHFSKLAEQSDAAEAHELWWRAGWDLGAEPMLAFAELLDHISATADAAGRSAQCELAKTHRACFRDRYGI